MVTLNANDLTLDEVHSLLNLKGRFEPLHFTELLTLEPLTDFEQQEMRQIREDFLYYLNSSKVLEGQVQFLVLAPLLRLAGFYHPPIRISLEQGIACINIADRDTSITGRMDILATKKQNLTNLWILVIEAKNSEVAALTGLAQLLTYAPKYRTKACKTRARRGFMRITTFFNHETLMNQITLLREALRPHLAWHGARLNFLATFLIALLRVKTVNFAELASAFGGQAHIDSHYKRIQRFFRLYELDFTEMAQAVVNLMAIPEPWVLSLDRTEWQFGGCVFNVLMLGVVHEGVAFPVAWSMLDKRGNSDGCERMHLINEFLKRFGDHEIACLTADREFVGKDWLGYLLSDPLTPFRIRIRENHTLRQGKRRLRVTTVFQDLKPGQYKVLRDKRQLWGHWVYIAALRLEDHSLLVVATQKAPHSAITDYAQAVGH